MSKDTAWEHLAAVTYLGKGEVLPVKISKYIKDEEGRLAADTERQPSQAFELLRQAVKARESGQEISLSITNQTLDFSMKEQKQQAATLAVAEASALTTVFAQQALANTKSLEHLEKLSTTAMQELGKAFTASYSIEMLKLSMNSLVAQLDIKRQELEAKDKIIQSYINERSQWFKLDRARHSKDLDAMTDKHFARQKVLELEMKLEEMAQAREAGVISKEQEEEDKTIIAAMQGQLDGIFDDVEGLANTASKAKNLIKMAKTMFGEEKKEEAKDGEDSKDS